MFVGQVWRYPVKSMLGEQVSEARISERGVDGCRRFALVHLTSGKIVSAKLPRLWERMLQFQAEFDGGSVKITAPDGSLAQTDEQLSTLLGQPVTLTSTPPADATLDRLNPDTNIVEPSRVAAGTFFDFAALHLIAQSTLDAIPAPTHRYRPNLVIDAGPAFTENTWVGRKIRLGTEVIAEVAVATPRCAVPTLAHGDYPRDKNALRVLNERNRIAPLERLGPQPCAGVYAHVLQPGVIRPGDTVTLV